MLVPADLKKPGLLQVFLYLLNCIRLNLLQVICAFCLTSISAKIIVMTHEAHPVVVGNSDSILGAFTIKPDPKHFYHGLTLLHYLSETFQVIQVTVWPNNIPKEI